MPIYIYDKISNEIAKDIIKSSEFLNKCKKNIDNILEDGKIDFTDIPYIIELTVDIINEVSHVNITEQNIENVFRIIIIQILKDYNFLNNDNSNKVDKLIESCLKLLKTTFKMKDYVCSCI